MSDIREQMQTWLKSRPDLNIDHLTAHTSLALSTGRGFFTGNIPRCDSEHMRSEFERVLRLALAGEILQPGGRNVVMISDAPEGRVRRVAKRQNFYQIATVRRVAEVLAYAHENAAIGVITADYGVGKTEAVKAWRNGAGRKTESIVIEFDGFLASNRTWFLQALAEQLGVAAGTNAARTFRQVCEALRRAPCLLIFDQCEMVHPRVLQLLRQVWDRTHEEGVGMALLAAPVLLTRMTSSRMGDLGALTSRVGIWAPLAGLAKTEMAAICKQEGLSDIDEAAFDLWWKATGGSMRRLMRTIDLLQAKHSGKRVTSKTIAGVAGHLWGMSISAEGAAAAA